MMIKEIRRELKRQLQEMMQFKFNLFFSNFGILIMVSAYLQYFKNTQSKFYCYVYYLLGILRVIVLRIQLFLLRMTFMIEL
ncbi:hypothetical protein HMPREF9393_0348 [Streptococcus sanguinis SK1056]|uniref:Uncharacterized protein n=1 Tax=Streptococcus sanguinis SK1056 TaxID=888820 RepID=F3U9P5_STRSA|nr:hypothetical protein HMPREF9393_0348 [Streptococcus sanguinis SK1056]